MTRRNIQFGTSRLLQAHVDLFVHEAGRSGDDIGPITVVKTSRAADRGRRIPPLSAEFRIRRASGASRQIG